MLLASRGIPKPGVVGQQFRRFFRGQHLDSVLGSQFDWGAGSKHVVAGSSMLVEGLDIAEVSVRRTRRTAVATGQGTGGGRQVVERVRLVPGRKDRFACRTVRTLPMRVHLSSPSGM